MEALHWWALFGLASLLASFGVAWRAVDLVNRATVIKGQCSAVLIELNPDYAEMAQRRITGDCPLFVERAE